MTHNGNIWKHTVYCMPIFFGSYLLSGRTIEYVIGALIPVAVLAKNSRLLSRNVAFLLLFILLFVSYLLHLDRLSQANWSFFARNTSFYLLSISLILLSMNSTDNSKAFRLFSNITDLFLCLFRLSAISVVLFYLTGVNAIPFALHNDPRIYVVFSLCLPAAALLASTRRSYIDLLALFLLAACSYGKSLMLATIISGIIPYTPSLSSFASTKLIISKNFTFGCLLALLSFGFFYYTGGGDRISELFEYGDTTRSASNIMALQALDSPRSWLFGLPEVLQHSSGYYSQFGEYDSESNRLVLNSAFDIENFFVWSIIRLGALGTISLLILVTPFRASCLRISIFKYLIILYLFVMGFSSSLINTPAFPLVTIILSVAAAELASLRNQKLTNL